MATPAVESFCSLCMCCKLVRLEFFQRNEMLHKISKYLLIRMEQNSFALCENCFNSLEDFHNFYERVHAAQRDFASAKVSNPTRGVASASTQTARTDEESREVDVKDDVDSNVEENMCKEEEISNGGAGGGGGGGGDVGQESSPATGKPKSNAREKTMPNEMEKKMLEFYNVKCEKCEDVKFTSFKMLSTHYATVHNAQGYIKCCKRNIRVNDKSYLRSHMLRHLEPDTCRCSVCGKQLSSSVMLKHHMILHKPTEERPFRCAECDKRFCCKNDLKNHEKGVHVAESERERFICDVCGKVFRKIANFRYHHATKHRQERKYICELCAKCFTTQRGLRTHATAAHDTKGPVECRECGKWLKNEDTFRRHLQLHRDNSYPCSECGKVCKSSTSLRSHMKKHSQERPYACHACGKAFKTKTYLKNHSAQHSGGSNYKCPFCAKSFVNMSNFYTHRKRMHRNEKSKPPDRLVKTEGGDANAPACDSVQAPVARHNIIVAPPAVKYDDFE